MAKKLIEIDGIIGKTCTECTTWKPLEEFYKRKTGVGGREAKCNVCKREQSKEKHKRFYENHKDRIKEYQSEYREENRDYYRKKNKERFQEKKEEIYEYRKQLKARKNDPSH